MIEPRDQMLSIMQRLSVVRPGSETEAKLDDTLDTLIEAAQRVILEAQSVQRMSRHVSHAADVRVSTLVRLRNATTALSSDIHTVHDSTEDYVLAQIHSSGTRTEHEPDIKTFLAKFSRQIKSIIGRNLEACIFVSRHIKPFLRNVTDKLSKTVVHCASRM